MKKLPVALAVLAATARAFASGDSGTGGVGEMTITGAQFGMMVGALAGLGVVVWLVAKVAMGGKKK
jgi:hypothetical protein